MKRIAVFLALALFVFSAHPAFGEAAGPAASLFPHQGGKLSLSPDPVRQAEHHAVLPFRTVQAERFRFEFRMALQECALLRVG